MDIMVRNPVGPEALMATGTPVPHRTLFLAAAAFNALAGLGLIFHGLWFERFGVTPYPDNSFFLALLTCLVLTFGYGYYLVAGDFATHRPIVRLGAIGKLLVFITALAYFVAGHASWHLALVTAGDLVFAVLFIRALLITPA